MRLSFLSKSQPKTTEISALEAYQIEGRAEISVNFGCNFGTLAISIQLENGRDKLNFLVYIFVQKLHASPYF